MTGRQVVFLVCLGVGVACLAAVFQPAPGYMDADYYYAMGRRLASGSGSQEPFLWNYLADPAGIPQPGFTYWMPLAALLSAAGMKISGNDGFWAARSASIILAGFVPLMTAALAYSLTQKRSALLIAGGLAIFSGFYLPFTFNTDTFVATMLLGGGFLSALARIMNGNHPLPIRHGQRPAWGWITQGLPLVGGLTAGCLHLARADGILWFVTGLVAIILGSSQKKSGKTGFNRSTWPRLAGFIFGYILVMAPWYARNLVLWNSLFPPGGSRMLWLTRYDEMYIYPAAQLTLARWWAAGFVNILQARSWAFGQNVQTLIAVQGGIFLAPLMIAGAWRKRNQPVVRLGGLLYGLTFLVMTLVFPYAGARGGFFHSGAALQPLCWALVPAGLEVFVEWGSRRRGWKTDQARNFFGAATISITVLISIFLFYTRVIGTVPGQIQWGQGQAAYARLEKQLLLEGGEPSVSVLINNPPGYYLATGRPGVVIPDGELTSVLAVARRYRAQYLLLEANHPQPLTDLYDRPGDRPGLRYWFSYEGTHVFEVSQ